MSPSLWLKLLSVRRFRNVGEARLEPSPKINVLGGDNGQGKTSVLEAIYFVATSKSFRAARPREMLAHEAADAMVRARFVEQRGALEPLEREQTASLVGSTVSVRIDANKPATLAAYATRSPVVVFQPDDLVLSTGPAAARRKLVDRLALYLDPSSAASLARYARALKTRQDLLRSRTAAEAELLAYERICAHEGAALTRARARAVAALTGDLDEAFRRIAHPELRLEARYAPGGDADPDVCLRELAARRPRDTRAPSATFGPHRDDVSLSLDGRPARQVASQGQHRALTLALKAAESAAIRAATGLEPIQLLDDVSSELDPIRTAALFSFLAEARGQIFLTTTRADLVLAHLASPSDARVFEVLRGSISPLK
jgi:DNA replication and repair protein RecF